MILRTEDYEIAAFFGLVAVFELCERLWPARPVDRWRDLKLDVLQLQTQVALLFARSTSTAPWRAVMAPRLAADTDLPDVERSPDGTAVTVDGAAPTATARRYADVLANPRSRFADQFERMIEYALADHVGIEFASGGSAPALL